MSEGRRKRLLISRADEKRIVAGLERSVRKGDFTALRTRAFVYLLLDGATGAKEALYLDCEEVVANPEAARVPRIAGEVTQRPCEANRFSERTYRLSARVRGALLDYLKAARGGDWIAGEGFHGPLFMSVRKIGKRISRHTAIDSWRDFLTEWAKVETDYRLDDVVYTGRMRFLEAAEGSSELLSDHAGISSKAATTYLEAPKSSPKDVLAKLDKRR